MLSLIYEVKAAIEASEHGGEGWCLSALSEGNSIQSGQREQFGSCAVRAQGEAQ